MACAPAINENKLDFPTPSGPITPTITPAGISRVKSSNALVLPYLRLTFFSMTTGVLPGISGNGIADIKGASLPDVLAILPVHLQEQKQHLAGRFLPAKYWHPVNLQGSGHAPETSVFPAR